MARVRPRHRVDVEQRAVGVEDVAADRAAPRLRPPAAVPARAGGRARADGLGRAARALGTSSPVFDEAEAQEPLGVEKRLRARPSAEHDHQELLAVAPRRHGEVVAGLVGEARLERLHAARIPEERDVARVHPAVVHERLAAEQRPRHRDGRAAVAP